MNEEILEILTEAVKAYHEIDNVTDLREYLLSTCQEIIKELSPRPKFKHGELVFDNVYTAQLFRVLAFENKGDEWQYQIVPIRPQANSYLAKESTLISFDDFIREVNK